MYNDLFSIGPVTVHGYGLMIGIGFICCVLLGVFRAKKHGMDGGAVIDIALFGIVCGFIGAKLLYIIVEFRWFLSDPLAVLGSEGFVAYGGIVVGIFSAYIYCRRKQLVFLDYCDLLAPSIAVAQGFGRLGCFLAGCCYGRETSSALGVIFPDGSSAPAGVRLIPTQLISAAGDFLIAIILVLFYKRKKHRGDIGAVYLLLYGVGRFCVEFLRADDRGTVGALSTSQFISIFIVAFAIAMFVWNRRREKAAPDEPSNGTEASAEAEASEPAEADDAPEAS